MAIRGWDWQHGFPLSFRFNSKDNEFPTGLYGERCSRRSSSNRWCVKRQIISKHKLDTRVVVVIRVGPLFLETLTTDGIRWYVVQSMRGPLTLCTSMSSVTRHQFLSQELFSRAHSTFFHVHLFLWNVKENQYCILEIVSRYIIHLKITKYNNSVNKTGI